ncbi:MAG: hypothetical protein QM813_06205, partial [Verrucomicrobiota bacterium]
IYQIARQIDGGEPVSIGVTGPKELIDSTLPQGAGQVVYQIRAVRSTAKGKAAEFLVKLGIGPTGAATATVAPAHRGVSRS